MPEGRGGIKGAETREQGPRCSRVKGKMENRILENYISDSEFEVETVFLLLENSVKTLTVIAGSKFYLLAAYRQRFHETYIM